jgi:hypothetical protein
MRLVKPVLFLGIALGGAVASADPQPQPRRPLATREGRPAVGNIGQRGRLETAPAARPRGRTFAAVHTALRAAQPAPAAELRVRQQPLMNREERPAVGNCVGKCPPPHVKRRR